MIFKYLAENIDNFIEELQFMKENETSKMEVFKIEDKVKVKKTFEIEE